MSDYNLELQSNNVDLQSILDRVNGLPTIRAQTASGSVYFSADTQSVSVRDLPFSPSVVIIQRDGSYSATLREVLSF